MIKKIISLTLSVTIVLGSVGTVAHADEKTKDVVLQNEIVTDATSREVAFDTDEVKLLNDVPDIIEEYEVIENEYVARNKEIETNEYTLGFKNADGSSTMRVFAFPVKYTDDEGEERDITLDIKENEAGGYVTENNAVITTFPENEEDGIKLQYEDVDISLIPCESYFVTPALEEETTESIAPVVSTGSMFIEDEWSKKAMLFQIEEQLATKEEDIYVLEGAVLSEDKTTVSYAWQDKTSLEYSLTYTGFKEDIVVEEYTGQTEYNFILHTGGLKLEKIEDSYFLTDEEGSIRATIGDIIIFTADERNNTFGEMEVETVKEHQSYKMIIKVDADYLKDKRTVYPIRIDPSIEVSYSSDGDGAIQDVTINSNAGSNGSATILTVGKRNTYGKSRVLMKFPGLDLSNIRSYHLITYAGVELRDLMCEQEQMAVLCYAFTGNTWSESTAAWDNVGNSKFETKYGQSTRQISYANGSELSPVHRYSFKITGAVHGWKKGTYSQSKGLIFKATDTVEGGSTEKYKTFASYNRSAYRPSLTIQFSSTASTGSITVPYSNNYHSLVANYVHPFKFTAPATDQYSIWTTGNLSTKVYVFDSSAMVTPKKSDKGSGHGNNCCITYDLTGGKTYYFVIQGTSTTVQGTYGLRVYRGLPMSGSEKPSYEDEYNSATKVLRTALMWPNRVIYNMTSYEIWRLNNCYTYALAAWKHPVTKKYTTQLGAQPGYYASYTPELNESHLTPELAGAEIIKRVKADLVALGYSENDIVSCGETEMPPEGFYKVALVLREKNEEKKISPDYHWYRQVSDENGRWKHKQGELLVDDRDESEKLIYNPKRCDTGEYKCFIGFYAIKAHNYNIS